MTLAAVVFDLDGTLVDTLPDLHAAVTRLLAEAGHAAPAAPEVRAMIGDGARALVARSLAWARGPVAEAELEAAHDRFLEIYNAAPCRDSRLFANVTTALDGLAARGLGLGVCTNKPQRPTEAILEGLGIAGRFKSVVGGDAVARRKPDAEHPRRVLAELGVAPERAVMVGDSHNDVASARAAGMACILVDFGYSAVPVAELGADLVIGDFAELAAALGALRPAA